MSGLFASETTRTSSGATPEPRRSADVITDGWPRALQEFYRKEGRLNVEEAVADTADKLKHLLPHWVEHNASHLESFRQWQKRAHDQGLDAVAEALQETVDAALRADEALRRATAVLAEAE